MTLMARWTYYSPFSPLEANISKSYCIQLTVICFPFLRWARGIRVWDNNGCRGGPRSAMTDCRILDLVTRLGPVVWPHYHQCYNLASPQSALSSLLQLTDIGVEHGSIDIFCFDNDPHWPSLRTDPSHVLLPWLFSSPKSDVVFLCWSSKQWWHQTCSAPSFSDFANIWWIFKLESPELWCLMISVQ